MRIDTWQLIGVRDSNKVMAAELSRLAQRALSVRPEPVRKHGTGALVYPWDPRVAHLAVNYHRTSTRALWDLYESRADRLEPLYDELRADVAADDRPWLREGLRISVTARNVGAFAAGERQIVGTVKNALLDGAAARGIALAVDRDRPDVQLVVRMHDEVLTVSIDLAGRSLSDRGYRLRAGAAAMREQLAALLVMTSRWDARREILLDPLCGAGTIAIEAAQMADARPLWCGGRRPAADHIEPLAALGVPVEPVFPGTEGAIAAGDLDPDALAAARANAEAAGVADRIGFRLGDFRELDPRRVGELAGRDPSQGVIVTNPPYGHRLGTEEGALYRDLVRWSGQFRGWRLCFFVANRELEEAFGRRRPRLRKPMSNGPLRGYLCVYEL